MRQFPTEDEVVAYREGYDNGAAEAHFDRASMIEECAKVVEQQWQTAIGDCAIAIAAAIRALKEKP